MLKTYNTLRNNLRKSSLLLAAACVSGAALAALPAIGWAAPAQPAKAAAATQSSEDAQTGGALASDPCECTTMPTQDGDIAAATTQSADAKAQDAQVASLIVKLNDDNYKVRESATKALEKIGKPALPALQAALKSASDHNTPEVVARAQEAIDVIEGKKTPEQTADDQDQAGAQGALPPGVQLRILNQPGMAGMMVHVTAGAGGGNAGNGTFNGSANINGRQMELHVSPTGITLTDTDNGQTKKYTAKDLAELKKKEPQAYKLVETYLPGAVGKGGNGVMVFGGGGMNGQLQIQITSGNIAIGSGGGNGAGAHGGAPTTQPDATPATKP